MSPTTAAAVLPRRRQLGGGSNKVWLLLAVCLLLSGTSVIRADEDTSATKNENENDSSSHNNNNNICTSPNNVFHVKVDIFASERGYYQFEECGDDVVNPTLGLEVGVAYTFVQQHKTNFHHPLRFGYFPDAHHVAANVLDPRVNMVNPTAGINNVEEVPDNIPITSEVEPDNFAETTLLTNTAAAAEEDRSAIPVTCATNMTCPAPMYFLNGGYLGVYSNLPDVKPLTRQEYDTGLDLYLDFFDRNLKHWTQFGEFSIQLKIDANEAPVDTDLFYYCHVHQFMAGRIKLLKDGQPIQKEDQPQLYFDIETPGTFDQQCGTYGLDAFQLPHAECPSRFVCNPSEKMKSFAQCIDAADCHMLIGMTNKVSSRTPLALFLHQMIPHHQNAVNMAKSVLFQSDTTLPCNDVTDDTNPYCVMEGLLRAVVVNQNYEVGIMHNVLASMNLPPKDDCQVLIDDTIMAVESQGDPSQFMTLLGTTLAAAAATMM